MTAGGRAGVPEPDLTLIVDGANVVGSRPDGWWRDRAGAAVRLYDELAGLAERGAAGIPAAQLATAEAVEAPAGPEQAGTGRADAEQAEQAASGQAASGQAGQGGPAPGRPAPGRPAHGNPAQSRPAQGNPARSKAAPRRPPGRTARRPWRWSWSWRARPRPLPPGSPPARPGAAGTGPVILGRSRWCPRLAPATTRSSGWPGPGRGSASWSPPTGNCAAGPWPPAPRWPGRHGYGLSCDVDPRAATADARIRRIAWKSPRSRPPPKKLMVALIVLVVVLLAIAAVAADRSLKARKRLRRRRSSAARLATAMAGAEATEQERRAHQQASGALTSVMPAIHERSARRV